MSAEPVPPVCTPETSFFELESVQRHFDRAAQYLRDRIPERLETEIAGYSCEDSPELESPLEAIFKIWWAAVTLFDEFGSSYTLELVPQVEIQTKGRRYRVDFEVVPQDKDEWAEAHRYGFEWRRIAIELDGHEFHERTVEQVIGRNQRDRDLQESSWRVVHFSGTEFYRQPEVCVQQVLDIANAELLTLVATLRQRRRQRDLEHS